MNALIGFFLNNRVAVMIFVLIATLTGTQAYLSLPREAAPDLEIPVVLVTVPYPGVSPTDIETLIANKLETKLKDLKSVKVMRTTAAEGAAITSIEFNPSVNIDDAVRKVREKVDLAKVDFPEDALDPVVQEVSFEDFPIITVTLSADYSLVRLKEVAKDLQEDLEDIQGVLDVKINGGVEREVQVLVDAPRLAYHGVSIDEVTRAINAENLNMPGGQVDAGRTSFLVRIPGEFTSARQIEDVVVKTRAKIGGNHTPLLIKDVATVVDTFKERATMSRINQTDSVSITVSKRGGENLIRITDEVKEKVAIAKERMPPGTTVTLLQDQSKFVRSMVSDLQNNIMSGLILVLAVLPFFLTVRSSIIVASAIPLSFLLSMTVLQAFGITLNMIVLFSLILSLGMLVDNSIVVVENIYRQLAAGKPRWEAALVGTTEVAWPVIASTATTVAAFAPLLFWPGIMGSFMGFLPRTVIITLLSSLFVALLINPVMCGMLLKVDDKETLGSDAEPTGLLYRGYKRLVSTAVKNGYTAVATVVASFVLLVVSVMVFGASGLGVEFFPDGTPDSAFVSVRAADGTRLEATDDIISEIERALAGDAHIQNFVASVGSQGAGRGGGTSPQLGQVTVDFLDEEKRTENSMETLDRIRNQVAQIPGAKFEVTKPNMGPPSGAPVSVEVYGPDWQTLARLAGEIEQRIKKIEGLVDLSNDLNLGRPEVQVRVKRDEAKLAGTSTFQIAQTVRTAVNGTEATKLRDGKDEIEVIVRLRETDRKNLDNLEDLLVSGRDGNQVPLRQVADIVTTSGAGSIRHKDRDRVVTFSANVDGRLPNDVQKDVTVALKDLKMPRGYGWRLAGENEEQEAAMAFLGRAFGLAFLLILLIMVLQFNSITTPGIIMTSVVLSTVGVLWGLVIFQKPFGVIMTGLGVISLAGVAVNNAIVLIDFIRGEIQKHTGSVDGASEMDAGSLAAAITTAGVVRLRPVLLTAITTVLGLSPMMFGISIDFINFKLTLGGRSGEMWAGMAIAVACGLVFTTFLTLVVVPTLYYLVARVTGFVFNVLPFLRSDDDQTGRAAAAETSAAAVANSSEPPDAE